MDAGVTIRQQEYQLGVVKWGKFYQSETTNLYQYGHRVYLPRIIELEW